MAIACQEGFGRKWYNGVVWFWEFTENGVHYLAASKRDEFKTALVVECVSGQELQQMRELEELCS